MNDLGQEGYALQPERKAGQGGGCGHEQGLGRGLVTRWSSSQARASVSL